jgi:drug/metabolite transporter (DMT)-like permease
MSRFHNLSSSTINGFLAIFLWSTTVALARSLSEQIGPITAAASVYMIASVACIAHLLFSKSKRLHIMQLPRRYVLWCGVLFVLYMLVLFLAVGLARNRNQVLEVGLLNYLWPTLTILFSLVLLNKKAGVFLLPGTLIGLSGVVLVLTQQGTSIAWQSFAKNLLSNPVAYSLGLTAAVSWALYSNLTRRWAGDERTGAVDIFLPATGIILLMIHLLVKENGLWNVRAVLEVGYLGVITWLAYKLWDVAMRKGDVVLVAACSYLTPFFSTLVSCVYLRVKADVSLWIGCVLIVVGSLLSWRSVTDR